jgi:hypothetical protein
VVTEYGFASPWRRMLYIWFSAELRRIKDIAMQSRTADRRCSSSLGMFRQVNNIVVQEQQFTICCVVLQISWFSWTLLGALWLYKSLYEFMNSFEIIPFVLNKKRIKWSHNGRSLISSVVFLSACFTFETCQYILNKFIILKYRIFWHAFHCIWCRYAVGLMHTS